MGNDGIDEVDLLGQMKGNCREMKDLVNLEGVSMPDGKVVKIASVVPIQPPAGTAPVGTAWQVPCDGIAVAKAHAECARDKMLLDCTVCYKVIAVRWQATRWKRTDPREGTDVIGTGIYIRCEKQCPSVSISMSKHLFSALHVLYAQSMGWPRIVTINRGKAKENRRKATKPFPTLPSLDRDEYPPAMTDEGGIGASVLPIPVPDNRGAGAKMGIDLDGIPDRTRVNIQVVP